MTNPRFRQDPPANPRRRRGRPSVTTQSETQLALIGVPLHLSSSPGGGHPTPPNTRASLFDERGERPIAVAPPWRRPGREATAAAMSGRGVCLRARARLRRFPALLAGCGEQVGPRGGEGAGIGSGGGAGPVSPAPRSGSPVVPRRRLPTAGAWPRRRAGRRSCGGTSAWRSSGRCGIASPGR